MQEIQCREGKININFSAIQDLYFFSLLIHSRMKNDLVTFELLCLKYTKDTVNAMQIVWETNKKQQQ